MKTIRRAIITEMSKKEEGYKRFLPLDGDALFRAVSLEVSTFFFQNVLYTVF